MPKTDGDPPEVVAELSGEPDVGPLDAPALETLVAGITDENRHAEVDVGAPVGREFSAEPAQISFDVACPDCDWCGGQVAVLQLGAATVRVGYDPAVADRVVGRDLQQVGFLGLSDKPGHVCVGAPPHPVCAAINLAYQSGYSAIQIVGAPPELRDWLAAFITAAGDRLAVTFTT